MKFSKLKIGQLFVYKGVQMKKSGPLQALETATGKEKMIMRAAVVTPLDTLPEEGTERTPDLGELKQAIARYHQTTLALLGSGQEPQAEKRIEEAYGEIRRLLAQWEQSVT